MLAIFGELSQALSMQSYVYAHLPGENKPEIFGCQVVANEDDASRKFGALAEGGQVQMPLGQTFWSPCFGMVVDRYGVEWMVSVAVQPA